MPAAGLVAMAAMALMFRRIEVVGDSMQPTLVAGDRVVAVRSRRAPPGALVALRDPRRPTRLLVKRVAEVGLPGITVRGDNPESSTDSRAFGPVPRVWGRILYRYRPPARAGSVR